MGGNFKQLNTHIIGVLKGGERREKRELKFRKNNDQNFSKFDANCKPTDPRNSINPKCRKHEEEYIRTHHNQQKKGLRKL